jgi:signal recognition particle subunit FFH/SRP54 (srp54)
MKEIAVKIVDTSGRDSLDEELLKELAYLKKEVNPDEILLVIDATIGQQAGIQARALQDTVGITGVIITKMDGTGKGGGALSAVAETGAPVYLIGTGEHIEDMEIFNPKKFLQRLLGMGDIEAIMEIAQETDITEEKAEETLSKMMSGKFNLKDMYEIWEKFSKPSILKRLFESLPLAKIPGAAKTGELDLDQAENRLSKYRVMLDSMTYYELENPDEINAKRIKRVARGSGSTEADVRHMLKEFKSMKENVKMMKGNRGFRKMLKAQMKSGSAFNLDEE